MANIHIARKQQLLGSFSEEEVREGVRTGRFQPGDLAWREGMPEWKALGEMAPQWKMEFQIPTLAEAPLMVDVEAGGLEPAWEEREKLGLFTAIVQTVQSILMHPTATFAAMKQRGGFANPLLYFVLLSSSMYAVSVFYQVAMRSLNPGIFSSSLQHTPAQAFSIVLIGSVLISPALYILSAFISSGIVHLFLKLLNGAHKPFETTFRVICYAQASAAIMNLIPMCGSLIALFLSTYCIIVGLKETHGTEGWRATLAFLLPSFLCCCALMGIIAMTGISLSELAKMGH